MPAYNDQKLKKLFEQELECLDSLDASYRSSLRSLWSKVLDLERNHAIANTNIAQQISTAIEETGHSVEQKRSENNEIH